MLLLRAKQAAWLRYFTACPAQLRANISLNQQIATETLDERPNARQIVT